MEGGERKCVCVCVSVCVWKREREREHFKIGNLESKHKDFESFIFKKEKVLNLIEKSPKTWREKSFETEIWQKLVYLYFYVEMPQLKFPSLLLQDLFEKYFCILISKYCNDNVCDICLNVFIKI